jgi:hypothetical protein
MAPGGADLSNAILKQEYSTPAPYAVSLAFAGLILAAADTVFALASGWLHPPGYFLLCAALAALASGAIGALADLSSRLRPWAVPVWIAATAVILENRETLALAAVWGVRIPLTPLAAALGFVAIRWILGLRRCGVGTEAIVAAGAITGAFLLLPRVVDWLQPEVIHAPSPAEQTAQITLSLLFAALGFAVVARLLSARPALQRGALLCVLILVPAAEPLLTRSVHDREISHPSGERSATSPSVLVVVLDTVGAGRLSLYGAERDTTRNLEAFLRGRDNHAVFPQAYANSSWTAPSHASLITGLIPSDHGAHLRKGNPDSKQVLAIHAQETLPEALRAAGYRSVAVLANWVPLMLGFDRGFDHLYRPRFPNRLMLLGEGLRKLLVQGLYPQARKPYPDADRISRHLLEELEPCVGGGCFVLGNYLDAHQPYIPGPECAGRFGPPWSPREWSGGSKEGISAFHSPERIARFASRHDEEICDLDRSLTQLLESLDEMGFLERNWVFITGDHGEAFAEHGSVQHGTSIYNEQVRVPLIALPPDGRRIEVTEQPVSLIDLTATIAEIAGVKPVGAGRSLLSDLGSREAKIEAFAISRGALVRGGEGTFGAAAIVTERHKLIQGDGELLLFDLRFDPGETVNVLEKSRTVGRELSTRLPPLGPAPGPAPTERLSREDYEMLRELGYVE